MPKRLLVRFLSPCDFARSAKRSRQLRASVAACLCIFATAGAADAATNLADGDWYVAVSCEQNNRARAFSFREPVRISGGEFSLTHHGANFVHELSGSIKDDQVRISGVGRNNTVSSDLSWRFSGRIDGSPEVRIKGTMNGRDTGATFYQDCEVFMSPAGVVASAKGASQSEAAVPDPGLTTLTWTQSGGALQPYAATSPEETVDSQLSTSEPQSAPEPGSQVRPLTAAVPRNQAMPSAPSVSTGTAKAPSRPMVVASPLVPSKPQTEAVLPGSPTLGESSRKAATEPPKPTTSPVPSSLFKAGDFWTDKAADTKTSR